MSVLIKGMEMPTSCDKCWALDDYGDYPRCRITEEQRGYNFRIREKRMDKCPLVPVPPHGRLIDANVLEAEVQDLWMQNEISNGDWIGFRETLNAIPTIIPAEEKGENYCADCHWYESEQQYCFRNGCHAYNESTCEHWEPMPADEPIPAPGGKTVPTTYDLLYEEGGYNSNGV